MPLKDISGQQFNFLTVLERDLNKTGNKAYWKCQCICGKQLSVRGDSLRSGNTKSCGCQKNNYYKDLTNQQFGYLTVIKPTEQRYLDGSIIWECQCKCGKNINAVSNHLLKGDIKSCGCYNKEQLSNRADDLIGKKFGLLTVISKSDKKSSDGHLMWKCICDCGNEKLAIGKLLKNGRCSSCGCIKSKGEAKINQLLIDNNIKFEREKIFLNCKYENGKYPRFDFYINNQYLIEFDGEQHYHDTNGYFNLSIEEIQNRDKYKNKWCKENNIPLIRIPYIRYNELTIEDLLLETSQFIERM